MFLAGVSALAAPVIATVLTSKTKESAEKWDPEKYNVKRSSGRKQPVMMARKSAEEERGRSQPPKQQTEHGQTQSEQKQQKALQLEREAGQQPRSQFTRESVEQLQNMEHGYGSFGVISLSNPGEARAMDREQLNHSANMYPDYSATGGTSFLSFKLLEPMYSQTPTPKDVTVRASGLPSNVNGSMKITKIGNDFAKGMAFVNDNGTVTLKKGLICGKRTLAVGAGSSIFLAFPDEKVTSMMDYDARRKKEKVDSFTNPRMELDSNGRATLLNQLEDKNSLEDQIAVNNKRREQDRKSILESSKRYADDGLQFGPNMERPDLDARAVARITRDGCPVRRGGANFRNESARMDNNIDMRMRSKPVRLQKKTDMTIKDGYLRADMDRFHQTRSKVGRDSSSRTGKSVRFNRTARDRADLTTRTYSTTDRNGLRRKGSIGGLGVRSGEAMADVQHRGHSKVRSKTSRTEPSAGVILGGKMETSKVALVGRAQTSMDVRLTRHKAPHTKYRREPSKEIYSALARQAPRKTNRAILSSTTYDHESAMKFQSDEFATIHGDSSIIHGSHRNAVRDVATRSRGGKSVVKLNRNEAWAAGERTIHASRTDRGANLTGPKHSNFGGRVVSSRSREYKERMRNMDNVTNKTYRHRKVHSKFVHDRQGDTALGYERYRNAALNTDVPVSLTNEKKGVLLYKDTRDASNEVGLRGRNQVLMNDVASARTHRLSRHGRLTRDNGSVADRRIFAKDMATASVMMDTASVQRQMRFVRPTETNAQGALISEQFAQGYDEEKTAGIYVPKDADSKKREDSRREELLRYDPKSNKVPIVMTIDGTAREVQGDDAPDSKQEDLPVPLQNPVPEGHDGSSRDVRFLTHSIQDADYDA